MVITKIRCKLYEPKAAVRLKVALVEEYVTRAVILEMETDEGIRGYGEGAPFPQVNGSDAHLTLRFIEDTVVPLLIGQDPVCIEKIHGLLDGASSGQTAARACVDIALHDILGKKAGLPLYKLLGGNSNTIESDMTVGIDTPENMADLARRYVQEGFRCLKIKTGISPEDDLRALSLIRQAVGPDVSLRMDANQGWGAKETVRMMKELESIGVDEVEQPVPHWNLDACRRIRSAISQDLMLDESVHSPYDAWHVLHGEAADWINIKLMKAGGVHPAAIINAAAQAAGIPCMVGCMNESRIAIAAGAALAAAKANIRLADLDGHRFIEESPHIRGGFDQQGGCITLLDKPGLGVDVDFDAL